MSPYLENDMDIDFCIVSSVPEVSTMAIVIPMEEPAAAVEVDSEDEDITSGDEEELLDYEELSDLSGDEFLDDEIYDNLSMTLEIPEETGMSAGLREQFELCLTTLQRPFQPANVMDPSAAENGEDNCDSEPQELNFSDYDLIVTSPPPAAPVIEGPAAPIIEEPASLVVVESADASALRELIRSRRALHTKGVHNKNIWIPYDLREKLRAFKNKRIAEGPYVNRRMLIQEYKFKHGIY